MSLAGNRLDILGETVNVRPKNYRQDRTSMRSPRQSRSIENSDSMVDKQLILGDSNRRCSKNCMFSGFADIPGAEARVDLRR